MFIQPPAGAHLACGQVAWLDREARLVPRRGFLGNRDPDDTGVLPARTEATEAERRQAAKGRDLPASP
jgi:hypothetical protein